MISPVKRNILLNPGPATTTDSVKYAQVVPDICPREKDFQNLMIQLNQDLVKIVYGERTHEAVLFCGSGTSAMDACINSAVPPGGEILILENGAYGERLVKIAESYRIPVTALHFDLRIDDLSRVETALKENSKIKAIAMIHHETTTGVLNPIEKVSKIASKNGCFFIVDAISSYAGIPIDLRQLDVDFLMSTSNKCIQGMAGLAFVICKKTALETIKSFPARSYYLNLSQQFEFFQKTKQMQFTPPVQVAYALQQAIKECFEETVAGRYERYTQNWKVLRAGLEKIGFHFLLKAEEESHILLSVLDPKNSNYDFTKLHDALYEAGFTIYPGKIANRKTFRIANMGAINSKDIQNFVDCLATTLEKQKLLPLQY